MASALAWLKRYRWPLAITALAIAVRVVWNLRVHPPGNYLYSDMAAYIARAERLAREPTGGPWPDEVFFPWGTHYLMAALLWVSGMSKTVLAVGWGVLNAAVAPIAYFMAGRLHGGADWSRIEHGAASDDAADESLRMARAVARVAGLFLVVYYPVLAYAGYYLSESPFTVFASLSVLLGLRMVDHGRIADALLFGVVAALAVAVRTQMIVGLLMLALLLVWRRRELPALHWRLIPAAVLPLALMLGASSLISHRHTGTWTPFPHNGAVNRAFGRCHAVAIRSRDAMFGPPSFGALRRNEAADPDAWLKLRPAMGDEIRVPGRMGDQRLLNALAEDCVKKTGYLTQAYYAMTHVVLLYGYHVAWPDMAIKPFKSYMRGWTRAHLLVFAGPALVGMAMGANRRWARHGVPAMILWSMLLTMALYMGSCRMRTPYDLIAIVLGLDVYARAATLLTRWRATSRG